MNHRIQKSMNYNCAVDGGNSSINIVINGDRFPIAFPSIQSDPLAAKADYNNAVSMKDTTTNTWDKLHVDVTLNKNNSSQKDEAEFLFGHMAEKYTRDLRNRQNFEKCNDKELAKWMIAALAYSLYYTKMKTEDYSIKENDYLQFNVNLATGLPYREGSKEEKRQQFANMFAGTHTVNFKHPIFKNLTVEIAIEQVFVFVEAEMALTLELNKEGGIYQTTPPELLLNRKMGILDIGGHTTESLTINYEMVQDQKELEMGDFIDEYSMSEFDIQQVTLTHLTYGIERGIGTIMEDVISEIDNKYRGTGKPLRSFTRRDIELAFTRKGMLNGKIGYILPEQIYIKDIFDRQARNLATDIVQKTHAMYQGFNVVSEIDTIFLCGGGSKISTVVDAIRSEFDKLGYDKKKILVVDDPIFANAKGYYMSMMYMLPELIEQDM